MELNNKIIGKNIAKFRKLRDLKAHDIAERLGLSEAAYTKYERGETAITLEVLQKVSDAIGIDPLYILSATPNNFIENIQYSPIAIQENSTFQTHNEQQAQFMLKLMENVVSLNERLITLLENKK